jgi:ABC-type antimicrobial peptide transport system permease subunit
MGQLKLLTKSIVFSTRSRRRFFTFVAIFAILSGATIILLNYFDGFSRQELLDQKGIVLKATDFGTPGALTLEQAENSLGTIDASKVIYYKYINFGSSLRIFSIDPKYPWAFTDLKPSNLAKGSFPSSTYRALVSEDVLLPLQDSASGNFIFTKPGIGTTFTIGADETSDYELKISGIFKKPALAAQDTREWIFITETAFDQLVDTPYLNLADSEIYVHSVTVIAGGDIFNGQTYTKVDELTADLLGSAGFDPPISTPKANKDELRNMMLLSLLTGLFGTFVVSTLYSYLITRFRRREVAVLKAMGYSKWSVRIVVLSEILVVAITGFFIGLMGIQAYMYLTRTGSYVYYIMFSPTALWSFLAVVISTVPGFILITTRILGVRPLEIFRQK